MPTLSASFGILLNLNRMRLFSFFFVRFDLHSGSHLLVCMCECVKQRWSSANFFFIDLASLSSCALRFTTGLASFPLMCALRSSIGLASFGARSSVGLQPFFFFVRFGFQPVSHLFCECIRFSINNSPRSSTTCTTKYVSVGLQPVLFFFAQFVHTIHSTLIVADGCNLERTVHSAILYDNHVFKLLPPFFFTIHNHRFIS